MADEEWEVPVGLTKECAISLLSDSSDEDGDGGTAHEDSPPSNAERGGGLDCLGKPTLDADGGGNCPSTISSYFQKLDNGARVDAADSCNRAVSREEIDCQSSIAADNANSDGVAAAKESQRAMIADATIEVDGDLSEKPRANGEENGEEDGEEEDAAKKDTFALSAEGEDENAATKKDDSFASPAVREDEGAAETEKNNLFASFAFVSGEASSSSASWRPKKRLKKENNVQEAKRPAKHKQAQHKEQRRTSKDKATRNDRDNKVSQPLQRKKLTPAEMMEMQKKDKVERKKLIEKWQAFSDPNAPLEQRRFQVLVAARLHAQCNEKMVSKAMDRLRKHFNEKDGCEGGLSVHSLASADAEAEIAPLLSSVLFGTVKAAQIVQGAKDVIRKYRCEVPESIASLKEITGIGPKLAEILDIVNRRKLYSHS